MVAKRPISIIIPVLNESGSINELISRIHAHGFNDKPEIIIIDGDAGGSTLAAIQDTDAIKIKSAPGRASQMNAGALIATGEILLFLHVDTELPQNALRTIASAMQNKDYVAGAFDLGIKSGGFAFRAIEHVASLRSRITRIPFGDQAIFIRKAYFDKIGGFQDIPLMEDVEIMRRIKKRGDKIIIIKDKVLTSPRRWEREGVLRCTLRNWLLQMLYLFRIPPHRLAKFYRHENHKV